MRPAKAKQLVSPNSENIGIGIWNQSALLMHSNGTLRFVHMLNANYDADRVSNVTTKTDQTRQSVKTKLHDVNETVTLFEIYTINCLKFR